MSAPFIRFAYGLVIGLAIIEAIIEAIVGEWRVVLCAVLALVMFRLATQGDEP
jgi:CBS domain containing-hemolysin-like protein